MNRNIVLFTLVIVLFAVGGDVITMHAATKEETQAIFMANFVKFVTWPEPLKSEATIIVGVIGQDPFGENLKKVFAGKDFGGKTVEVKSFQAVPTEEVCHILFISSSEEGNLSKILEALKNLSILTVGEMKQFVESGGMINFTLVEDKVRFEINLGSAKKVNLKINPKLLKLAVLVKQ